MAIKIHPHAKARMAERGASEEEVLQTVERGERFPAKYNRTGFRHNFSFNAHWRGTMYHTKQIEAYALQENDNWIILTVITKFF